MKIGFDLDGVLINHDKNREKITRKSGYRDCEIIEKYIYGKATLKASPMEKSRLALKILGRKDELFIISRRRPENRKFGYNWLEKYFNFPKKNIFFVDSKKDKSRMAGKLGIGFYVDDDISILKIMPAGVAKILFDQYGKYKREKIKNISILHSFAALPNLINLSRDVNLI